MSDNSLDSGGKRPLSPTAIRLPHAAQILSKLSSQPVTIEMLEEDIAAGAPTNVDGTLNLVFYAAWLAKEISRGD